MHIPVCGGIWWIEVMTALRSYRFVIKAIWKWCPRLINSSAILSKPWGSLASSWKYSASQVETSSPLNQCVSAWYIIWSQICVCFNRFYCLLKPCPHKRKWRELLCLDQTDWIVWVHLFRLPVLQLLWQSLGGFPLYNWLRSVFSLIWWYFGEGTFSQTHLIGGSLVDRSYWSQSNCI